MLRRSEVPVHGSVIQRSLIPEGLGAVLNIATVPISELDTSSLDNSGEEGFRRLVGQVIGIPHESMIDEGQYQNLARILRDGRFWEEMAMRAHSPYAKELYHLWYKYFHYLSEENAEQTRNVAFPDRSTELLASHSLSLMVSPVRPSAIHWSLWSPFFPQGWMERSGWLADLALTEEAMELGMACFTAAISPDERVLHFTHAVAGYDIPTGQSPNARSDSLVKLIETSKRVCLAPLAIGGTAAISQLSQGNYVAALLSTGTASAMTLMLIGTVSVADYLVHYLLHRRNRLD